MEGRLHDRRLLIASLFLPVTLREEQHKGDACGAAERTDRRHVREVLSSDCEWARQPPKRSPAADPSLRLVDPLANLANLTINLPPPAPQPNLRPVPRDDNSRSEKTGSDNIGTDKTGSDKIGTEKIRSEKIGTDNIRSDKIGTDNIRSEKTGSVKLSESEKLKKPAHRRRQPSLTATSPLYTKLMMQAQHDYAAHPSAMPFAPSLLGNIGLHNAVHSLSQHTKRKLWIGLLGVSSDSLSDLEKKRVECELDALHNAVPVYASDDEIHGHYNQFCKEILWPTMHYILPEYKIIELDEKKAWQRYVEVNQKFADTLVKLYQPNDLIWIHDYHLLLVPQMVRKQLPNAAIGFFLHIPFPSSEIFRCLHVRKDLLEGMLGADLIGFQTYSFARHFLQTCTRLLAYETTPKGIRLENNAVSVGIFPIGIDVDALNMKRKNPEVLEMAEMLREKYAGRKVIVGRDKLDPIKGVKQKLLAFELFLKMFPQWQGKVVLVQVALLTVEHPDYQAQISEIVSRINSRFGTIEYAPVVYLHQDISFNHYLALLSMADACLITALRDGYNLTSHEFIVSTEKHAPLIFSEFTGAYGSFGGAIRINPWNYKEVANAIHDALDMSEEDRIRSHRELMRHVVSNTGAYWSLSYVTELKNVSQSASRRIGPVFTPLLTVSDLDCVQNVGRKVVVLNYDGVLVAVPKVVDESCEPSSEVIDLLGRLCERGYEVYIVSGRKRSELDAFFRSLPKLGLSAENGSFLKLPDSKKWETTVSDVDLSWRNKAIEVFEYYTERTPGSCIEKKDMSIVWDYRQCDPSFGSWQARECQNHISDAVENIYPIHAVMGQKYIEIRPRGVSKTGVLKRIMATECGPIAFCLCIGNCRDDEELFEYLNSRVDKEKQTFVTCTVGERLTKAGYCVPSFTDVVDIIRSMVA